MCDNKKTESSEPTEICLDGFNSISDGDKYIAENIIDLDIDDLYLKFDKRLFQFGINSMSELCGAITALVNVGITPDVALQYIADKELTTKSLDNSMEANKMNAEITLKQAQINADAVIGQAKYDCASIQKSII